MTTRWSASVANPAGRPPRLRRRHHRPTIGLDEHDLAAIRSNKLIVARSVRIARRAGAVGFDGVGAGGAAKPGNLPVDAQREDLAHMAVAVVHIHASVGELDSVV